MGQGAVRWGGARRRASWNALSPPSTSVQALKPSCIGKPSLMSVSGVVLFTSRGLRVQPSNASLEARVVDCRARSARRLCGLCLVDVLSE